MTALSRRYGASPLHLLAHVAALGVAGYALAQILGTGGAANILLWLVGAVLLHDFVLLPLYGGLDRGARRVTASRITNFVRIPAGLSGLLLLVYLPAILGRGERTHATLAGLAPHGYLARWLLASGLLFGASALLLLLSARRRHGERSHGV